MVKKTSRWKKKKTSIRKKIKDKKKNVQFREQPSMVDMEAPKGFRSVSISQALIEFGKPIMKLAEEAGLEDRNESLRMVMNIWNYALSLERGDVQEETKGAIAGILRVKFDMTSPEANDFIDSMVDRKAYLFPSGLQPDNPRFMFIRKEGSHEIEKFDYEELSLSENPIPPDSKDKEVVDMIKKMDTYILNETEYDEWEDHFLEMSDKCEERYTNWLEEKGVSSRYIINQFGFGLDPYLDFIYRYMHDSVITLKDVHSHILEEFLFDYLLRKVMAKPEEYPLCPPTLKGFYQFLEEKNYLKDAESFIKLIDEIEPYFIDTLKDRYM